MSREWIHENPAQWDERKSAMIGAAPKGSLPELAYSVGDLVGGEWWRVEDDGAVVGYGWMDTTWGDAEILLVVHGDAAGKGVGTWILDHLEQEAASRGLNYLYNEVRESHPDRDGVTGWLKARSFERSHDDRLLRRQVRRGDAG